MDDALDAHNSLMQKSYDRLFMQQAVAPYKFRQNVNTQLLLYYIKYKNKFQLGNLPRKEVQLLM